MRGTQGYGNIWGEKTEIERLCLLGQGAEWTWVGEGIIHLRKEHWDAAADCTWGNWRVQIPDYACPMGMWWAHICPGDGTAPEGIPAGTDMIILLSRNMSLTAVQSTNWGRPLTVQKLPGKYSSELGKMMGSESRQWQWGWRRVGWVEKDSQGQSHRYSKGTWELRGDARSLASISEAMALP